MRWTVLIPAKALPAAKSRLTAATGDPDAHRRLVEAIRRDTVEAARATPGVARVIVVTDAPGPTGPGPDVLVQTAPGLNPALVEAAAHAMRHWPGDGVAALVGDLPALRPANLAEALGAAVAPGTAHVPDAAGTGTTLLAAAAGHILRPEFGAGSAARHRRHSTALPAADGLRADVDTLDDLRAAALLGVGPATAAVLAADHPGVTVRSTCIGMIRE